MQLPSAVPQPDGTARLFNYTPAAVGGTGSDIPLIMGLDTVEANRGVIETKADGRMLTFPGPGGYEVNWAPGAIHIPLTPAPSGHLCV